jgi:hypothetical protein
MRIATVEGVPTSDRTAAASTRMHERRPEPSNRGGGALSPIALAIASVASVVSAVVVSHVWGPGTLYGAAATPVIVAFVSEALRRPHRVTRQVIESARTRQTHAFDPIEEGRRGLHEGALVGDAPAASAPAPRSKHRAGGILSGRRRLVVALATGVLAFAVAAVALTGGELVFGKSAVGGVSSRTTLFGGAPATKKSSSGSRSESEKTKSTTSGQDTTSTSVAPGTTSTSTSTSSTPTTTTPSTGTTSPSPTAPQGAAPQGTTSTPSQSPTPAPPAQTTPTPTAP